MNTHQKRTALLALCVLAGGILFVSPVGAVVLEQATSVRRSFYPEEVVANHTGAAQDIDQTGSGAILNLSDGGTDEYTFDQSSATFLNTLTLSGGANLTGHLVAATAAPAAVVTGTALAPAGLLQPVSMATAGTVPLTIPSAGRIICTYNTGSQGITIADSGNQVLAGNITLGQYDVLCGISDGTRFIEITRSNN